MSVETRNWVVVRGVAVEQVDSVLAEMLGWIPAPADEPGTEDVCLRSAGDGLTLVELPWEQVEAELLAQRLSKRLSTEALSFSWCDEVPELALLTVFRHGRELAVSESGFSGIATAEELEEGWPSLDATGDAPSLTRAFKRPLADDERVLFSAVAEHLVPVLIPLGLAPEKLAAGYQKRNQKGLQFGRSLADGTRLVGICLLSGSAPELEFWHVRGDDWHRLAAPRLTDTFNPQESEAQLHRYCQLLAAVFVRNARSILGALPGLADTLTRAESSPRWMAADAAFEALWRNRMVARERTGEVARARVVFRGARLLLLETTEAEPRRFTFRFDTAALPGTFEAELSGFWERSGGATFVRTLRIGVDVYEFDEKGELLAPGRSAGAPQ